MELLNYPELTSMASSADSSFTKSAQRMKTFLSRVYTLSKEYHCSLDTNKPKKNLQVKLKDMFSDKHFDSNILYLTGAMCREGGFLIQSKDFGEEELHL